MTKCSAIRYRAQAPVEARTPAADVYSSVTSGGVSECREASLVFMGEFMNLFKTKVLAPKPGGNHFSPTGIVEADFQYAYLANDAEVDAFRAHCISEIERVCAILKRGMRSANDRLHRDVAADRTKMN